jgi:hypothetical protein
MLGHIMAQIVNKQFAMVVLIQSLQKELASKNPYLGLLRLIRTFDNNSPIRKALISKTLNQRPDIALSPITNKIINDQRLTESEMSFILSHGPSRESAKKVPSMKRKHYPRLKALCSSKRRSYDSLVFRKS